MVLAEWGEGRVVNRHQEHVDVDRYQKLVRSPRKQLSTSSHPIQLRRLEGEIYTDSFAYFSMCLPLPVNRDGTIWRSQQ
jgi:hypothetical protein